MSARDRLLVLRQELEWRKCRDDPAHFFTEHWHIAHPAHGRIKFELWDAQRQGLKHWQENRYSLTLKARQLGWSTLVAAYAFWLAFFHDDKNIIMISRTERESVALLKKAKYGASHLPRWMLERGPRNLVDHQQRIQLANGSQITSLPSANDPARGESASLIIVDEWAFLPNPEDAWASIEPVADVGGRIIGLSTANGWGEFFHTLWQGARDGTNFFKALFIPWSGNEQRDQAWFEAKVRSMLPWQRAQEYPTTEDEAFISSGRTVFDLDSLAEMVDPEEPQRGDLLPQGDAMANFDWRPNADGHLRVWEFPKVDGVYVMGADVAEGLEWGDYSSAHVIDVATGQVVAVWHGHTPADLFGEELWRLGCWYNSALLGPESNNHGLTTITTLRRLDYPKIYRRRRLNSTKGKIQETSYGWATNVTSKPKMIDELAKALRDGPDDGGILLRDSETLAELKRYVRDSNGKMGGSPHDDRVISLAIANQMREFAWLPEYREERDDTWSWDWWRRTRVDAAASDNKWVIGRHAGRAA